MEELQARLAEVARAQPHVTQLLPRRLVELQQHLAALSRPPHSRFHMPAAELHALAQERFGMGEDMARLVLGLLHDWGVVHVLPGGEQVVLAPQQLTDVLACVITAHQQALEVLGAAGSEGLLVHSSRATVWERFVVPRGVASLATPGAQKRARIPHTPS